MQQRLKQTTNNDLYVRAHATVTVAWQQRIGKAVTKLEHPSRPRQKGDLPTEKIPTRTDDTPIQHERTSRSTDPIHRTHRITPHQNGLDRTPTRLPPKLRATTLKRLHRPAIVNARTYDHISQARAVGQWMDPNIELSRPTHALPHCLFSGAAADCSMVAGPW